MKLSVIFIIVLSILKKGNGKSMQYFSNEKLVRKNIFGAEHLIKEYVTLLNDPNANLPNSFTICSSIFIKFRTTAVEAFCDFQYCSDETRLFANFDILIQEKV